MKVQASGLSRVDSCSRVAQMITPQLSCSVQYFWGLVDNNNNNNNNDKKKKKQILIKPLFSFHFLELSAIRKFCHIQRAFS